MPHRCSARSAILLIMAPFLPPETGSLVSRVVKRNMRRARRVTRALRPFARTAERRAALLALGGTLDGLRGDARDDLLFGPGMRAWLAEAEMATALVRPAGKTTDLKLFDLVSRGPYLARLLPGGRLDRGFCGRAAALGRRMLERAFRQLPLLLAGLTPPDRSFGPFTIDVTEDGEEARRRGEIHIDHPVPGTIRVGPRARLFLIPDGVRVLDRDGGARFRARGLIDGSPIVLSRRVVSGRRVLRPGSQVRGLARRLSSALGLLRAAWKEAHAEVLAHTRVVVPLMERGTVSYSLPDRPGTSYINMWGKSVVDLADDLLHETAHHRLHGLEETEGPLDLDDGEPRYFSPWRRSIRPLHGILHAAYTFAWRAELLRRLLAFEKDGRGRTLAARPSRANWLRRELRFEIGALRHALRDLRDAESRGLLTPSGRRLLRALRWRVVRLARGRVAPPPAIGRKGGGRPRSPARAATRVVFARDRIGRWPPAGHRSRI